MAWLLVPAAAALGAAWFLRPTDDAALASATNVALVLMRSTPSGPEVMLTREAKGPEKNRWALPGGKIDDNKWYSHLKPLERATGAMKDEARGEVGLQDSMWYNHSKYDVNFTQCWNKAVYFFRVLRPGSSRKWKLVYPDGTVGVQFPDREIDSIHWVPLHVFLAGETAVKFVLSSGGRRSSGLRKGFQSCLKNRKIRASVQYFMGALKK